MPFIPRILLLLILPLVVLPHSALADTAYVTDQLRLGLYEASDTSGRAMRTLESGQALDVVDRSRNYAHVRLPDGTEGYVKAAYLVTDKPARLIVQETQTENERLKNELKRTQAAFAEPSATIASLETQLDEQKATLEERDGELRLLRDEHRALADRQNRYKYSLPLSWVGGAVGVCLLAGFLGGLWWTDYRSRKRHGGIRIY